MEFSKIFSRKKDKARRLLELMRIEEKFMSSIINLVDKLPKNSKEVVEDSARKSLPALVEAVEDLYAARLKKSTIDDLISFYESESGKDLVGIQEQLDRDVVICSTAWIHEVLREADEEVRKIELREMAERGVNWRSYIPPLDQDGNY